MSFILVISGPSGVGKSTLLSKLFTEFKDELYFSISSTTRKPRNGEKDGEHYHFITQDEFQQDIKNGYFLEWALVHQNYYGTSLKQTQEALSQGKIVIFDIDVQGFHQIVEKLDEKIVSVFIITKDKEELKKRLIKRNADTIEHLEQRLENARLEMKELDKYDYLIINENLEQSYEALKSILITQKIRTDGQNLEQIRTLWNKGE
ncbi:guanylate kinase [Campylobacter cuniculorum]|uniref:Guanylate kinase n=2 Tax=Campylobacter cuniculorum TaxID=374106 RepID=A0A1W6BYC2_9BACT|nr:guanylate kinase [Campylobacter cuniculorum]ARJ57088.1 deoxyguanylate kinase / guanylate kinase [Campylobacter cuniculorum DSM 23162 = LMG 24588]QOR04533.1 guanylate kinase [Campylobacter cuniculorum]